MAFLLCGGKAAIKWYGSWFGGNGEGAKIFEFNYYKCRK